MTESLQWRHNEFDSRACGLSMLTISGWQAGIDLSTVLEKWVEDRTAEGWNHAWVRMQPDKVSELTALEDAGFRCVDSLITLTHTLRKPESLDPRVGLFETGDDFALQSLSQGAFERTRYAKDPWMPPGAADRVMRAWISNNIKGRADMTWVARVDGVPVGFLSSLWRPAEGLAVIDLIAVDRRCQGIGLGRALTHAMVSHYLPKARQILVGTQAANEPALALYQACGFRLSRFELGFARQLKPLNRFGQLSSVAYQRELMERRS